MSIGNVACISLATNCGKRKVWGPGDCSNIISAIKSSAVTWVIDICQRNKFGNMVKEENGVGIRLNLGCMRAMVSEFEQFSFWQNY